MNDIWLLQITVTVNVLSACLSLSLSASCGYDPAGGDLQDGTVCVC